jgi:Flp pilus assembly protein TadB
MGKLKASRKRLKTKLQKLSANFSKPKSKPLTNEPRMTLEKPLSMAYQLMGNKTARFMPLFKDLDQNLQKSGLRINFKAYVSLTILTSLLITLSVAVVLPIFYLYPVYCADKHKRELDGELPFTTGYMAILASAGVTPEKIFHSISTLNVPLAASTEAKEVIKNINLFGLDVISALEKTSSRTPSRRFRDTIEHETEKTEPQEIL